jgi:hypothetical protein
MCALPAGGVEKKAPLAEACIPGLTTAVSGKLQGAGFAVRAAVVAAKHGRIQEQDEYDGARL